MYGGFAIVSAVVAPSASRSCISASTLARYCALFVLHGVSVCAPKSSFSAISGVWQPVTSCANANSDFAFASIVDGSAGAVVVPTRLFNDRSK